MHRAADTGAGSFPTEPVQPVRRDIQHIRHGEQRKLYRARCNAGNTAETLRNKRARVRVCTNKHARGTTEMV